MRLATLVLGGLTLTCGARTEIGGADTRDASDAMPTVNAIFGFWCNDPSGDLGFYVNIDDPPRTCGQVGLLPNQHVVNLDVVQRAVISPGTTTFSLAPFVSGVVVDADTCVGPSTSTCRPANGGSFTLVDFDPRGAVADGSDNLRFQDRDPIVGSFHATRCPMPLPSCTDAGL